MRTDKFTAALRAKYRTPADALRALGIDENILDDNNRSDNMARSTSRDQAMTVDDLVEAIESLPEEERLELKYRLNGEGAGEDTLRGGGRARRRARDAEWNTEGRPKVGPTEEVRGLERDREDAQDRRRRVGMDSAAVASFAKRFPNAARIKI
jgi:hypothetical protein